MVEAYELSVSEAAQKIKDRQLSPSELARSLLRRIDSLDETLRAWVTVDQEEVLTTARLREQELEAGKSLGVLHGVPVGLKDIFYTAGMKTTACSAPYPVLTRAATAIRTRQVEETTILPTRDV